MRRVADQMDHIATKRYQEKFANQFNYSLKQQATLKEIWGKRLWYTGQFNN